MTTHLFVHSFKSGNAASVRLTLPRHGHPVYYLVRWRRAAGADDMAEYRTWKQFIVKYLEHAIGRPYRMTDANEERLATA